MANIYVNINKLPSADPIYPIFIKGLDNILIRTDSCGTYLSYTGNKRMVALTIINSVIEAKKMYINPKSLHFYHIFKFDCDENLSVDLYKFINEKLVNDSTVREILHEIKAVLKMKAFL